MTVTMAQTVGSNVLEIGLGGTLTTADCEAVSRQIERMLREHLRLRLFVSVTRVVAFAGCWDDVQYDAKRFKLVERVAMVGEPRWNAEMAAFAKAFPKAAIEYFPPNRAAEARGWITEVAG